MEMNDEINQLEQYLLSKDKKTFLDGLIKNSEKHYYFSLLEAIDSPSSQLTHQQELDIKKFRKFRTVSSKAIRLRYLFRKYDLAKTEEEKKKILKILNSKLFKVSGIFEKSKDLDEQKIRTNRFSQKYDDDGDEEDSLYSSIKKDEGDDDEDDEDEDYQEKREKKQDNDSEESEEKIEEAPDVESKMFENPLPQQEAIEEETSKHQLNTKLLDIQAIIQKISLKKLLTILYQDSLTLIPLRKIIQEQEIGTIKDYLQKVELYSLPSQDVVKIFSHLQSLEVRAKDFQHYLEYTFPFNTLTLEQLEELSSKFPEIKPNRNFAKNLFLKKFDLKALNELKGEDKISQLKEVLNLTKTLDPQFQSLTDQVKYEILYQGIKCSSYDMDLFQEYIIDPKTIILEMNKESMKELNQSKKKYDSQWESFLNFTSCKYPQTKLIKKYIVKYFQLKNSTDIKPLDKTFNKKYLQRLLVKTRLYAGDQTVSDVSHFLKDNEIAEIFAQKELKIFKSNKTHFGADELISLQVRLKNIDKLFVKIFNFLPENYYIKHNSQFNNHIDLDGLNPTEEVKFDFTEDHIHPCTRIVKTFEFESIQKIPKGIFIIEFFSSGIASRAIIYKGTLSHFSRSTIAGQELVIIDEKGEIQVGKKVGVWLDNIFYQADSQSGKILIPYIATPSSKNIILVSGDFASLQAFEHLSENYFFDCNFIFNQESFIFGNLAKIIINPRLTINSEIANLELLREVLITVVTTTTDNVPSTTRFTPKSFKNSKDEVIQFNIPAKTTSVNIVVTATLDTMSKSEPLKLSRNQYIHITQNISSVTQVSLNLQHTDQYYLVALGKNGEPIKNLKVKLVCFHKFMSNQAETGSPFELETDEKGRISLGNLQNIQMLQASALSSEELLQIDLRKQWDLELNKIKGVSNLPNRFDIREGEDLRIPLLFEKHQESIDSFQLSLVKLLNYNEKLSKLQTTISASCVSNEQDKVKLQDSLLVVKGIDAGKYLLRVKQHGLNFLIVVHANSQIWPHSFSVASIIDKEQLHLNLGSTCVQEQPRICEFYQEEKSNKIQISKTNDYANFRVHVIAQQLYPNQMPCQIKSSNDSLLIYPSKIISLEQTENKYMSNRQLGDEFAYVLDRKIQSRFIGNSLKKPSLALKRNLVQETSQDVQALKDDSSARSISRSRSRSLSCDEDDDGGIKIENEVQKKRKRSYDRDRKLERRQDLRGKKCSSHQISQSGYLNYHSSGFIQNIQMIDASINFLKNGCLIFPNLVPDSDGVVRLTQNLENYSSVQVILVTPISSSTFVFNTNFSSSQREIITRDLRQKTNLQKGKYYSITRNTEKIFKGNSCTIDDVTSTEFSIVDSLEKLFDFQSEISNFQAFNSDSGFATEWNFLKKWNTLNFQEKSQKYAEYSSHELNFFIFRKDPTFFSSVIAPHLINKIEVTLVDLFLMNKYDKLIEKYAHLELLEKLNSFELCLLVLVLTQSGKKDLASKIVEMMGQLVKQNYIDKEVLKKSFDIILNSNSTNNLKPPGGGTRTRQTARKSTGSKAPRKQLATIAARQTYGTKGVRQDIDDEEEECSDSLNDDEDDQDEDDDLESLSNEDQQYDLEMEMDNDDDYQQVKNKSISNYMQIPLGKGGKGRGKGGIGIGKVGAFRHLSKVDYNFDPLNNAYQKQRQLFQSEGKGLKQTGEYVERHYFSQKNDEDFSIEQMKYTQFWLELSKQLLEKQSFDNFLSSEFHKCCFSNLEMILVLSLLELPFQSPIHETSSKKGIDSILTASDNLLLFTKEIKETTSCLSNSMMINQRFFDPQDKYQIQGEEQFEKDAQEFVKTRIYGCQVIVTNCSGGAQEIQILTEVPEGSIPVSVIEYTKTYSYKLDPYSTKIIDYFFYFPEAGVFEIYPSNVSKNGQVICVARNKVFEVQNQIQEKEATTLAEVLMKGSKEKILEFLQEKTWYETIGEKAFSFKPILSLCSDKDFYLKLVTLMRQQGAFSQEVWKFSLLHADQSTLVDFLNCQEMRNCIKKYISFISCSLLKVTQELGEWKRIKEYYPLLNSRVHLLKRDRATILNRQFRSTYCHFLRYLAEKGSKIESNDRLAFVYYLLLQDRVDGAISQFEMIEEDQLIDGQGQIQYDYIKAYLDFYRGHPNFKVAREIVEKYLDYPVTSWRNIFYDIANQLGEYDGEDLIEQEINQLSISKEKKEEKIAPHQQSTLVLRIDNQQMVVEHKYVQKQLKFIFYKIDLEVFFSKKPFLYIISEDFSYLQPSHSELVELNEEDKQSISPSISRFEIPKHLRSQSLYIQALSGPHLKSGTTYFSSQLKVSVFSDEAYLKVTDQSNQPLSRIYIKVFSKNKAGEISFVKDGYTDLRGNYDYLLSSTVKFEDFEQLSVFVTSDDLGSLILQVKPPKKIGQYTETVQLKSKNWNKLYNEIQVNKISKEKK